MVRKLIAVGTLGLAVAAAAVVGCNNAQPPSEPAAGPQPGGGNPHEDHAHKPGAHGGIIASLGRDSYHVEAVFAADGVVRLYTLGKDEARVQEVEAQELVGYATAVGSSDPAEEVKFTPQPQPGDTPGKTSLFVGQLPPGLRGKAVQVTVNNIRIGGERFRFSVTNEAAGHDAAAMPAGVADDDARELYLTPGGKYTAEDIRANGGTTPQVKYKGIRAAHDDAPRPGDVLCPVSKTKANPKFTWVVDGKPYEFCCTPCIDEFVERAKTKPDEVPDPAALIKK
jgi:hypothetical protein